ncbi:reverse transcriptase N-terminal domain-containing protein [Nostoc sp.]|uniref:reverse transcriptase N-terminal domain-containing protein n=1 Tax=Nostoc sp. TaxID=1180 RepID=UPI002FF49DDE
MNKPNSDSEMNIEGWKTINWRKAERYVFKLQKRIYAASRRGDVKQCRKLQKTLNHHKTQILAPSGIN